MSVFRGWLAACLAVLAIPAAAEDLKPLLDTLVAVGPKGAGNVEAARAWAELAKANAAQLPDILVAFDRAGPLAANWLRCAVDAIAERELCRGGQLPKADLERFVRDTAHAPRARRLAYEWLVRVDPAAPGRLLPGMLDDPSLELRRDAVARLIAQGESGGQAQAVPLYRQALTFARDPDQVRLLATRLKQAGEPVDLARHFGFILRWKVIGPFDNTDEKGYDVAYPPQRQIDLAAAYPGKHGEVKWIDYVASDDYGSVDFNKALGEQKDVAAYAMTEFIARAEREVEFRLASDNAVKLWLNGALLDEHRVYHSGSQMDQYTSRGVLRPGRNVILVEALQNAQTQDWARAWGFQLRVCDATGGAVLSADRE